MVNSSERNGQGNKFNINRESKKFKHHEDNEKKYKEEFLKVI